MDYIIVILRKSVSSTSDGSIWCLEVLRSQKSGLMSGSLLLDGGLFILWDCVIVWFCVILIATRKQEISGAPGIQQSTANLGAWAVWPMHQLSPIVVLLLPWWSISLWHPGAACVLPPLALSVVCPGPSGAPRHVSGSPAGLTVPISLECFLGFCSTF